MAKDSFIDIGKTPGMAVEKSIYDPKKLHYPSITVGELEGFDPEVDDEVVLKGVVTRCVDDTNGGESCVIEINGVQCDCEGDLADAMNKIAKKKMAAADDGDE